MGAGQHSVRPRGIGVSELRLIGDEARERVTNIVVVDYGASNLKSIVRGLERAGATVHVARTPAEMAGAAGLVLPGVGAAGTAMQGLRTRGLDAPLRAAIES